MTDYVAMKTRIINGVEYETETHDFDKTLSKIKIPKGWRLWTAEECLGLFNSHEKELNLSDCWFFIKQPFDKFKNMYVARFGAFSVWADLLCVGGPTNSDASLGVRFCREVKK
jgi:hypothetical protein